MSTSGLHMHNHIHMYIHTGTCTNHTHTLQEVEPDSTNDLPVVSPFSRDSGYHVT